MHMNRRVATVIGAVAAMIALTGCGSDGVNFHVVRSIEDDPTSPTTKSQVTSPPSSPAATTPSDAAAENDTTTPAAGAPVKVTPAGAVCDMIVTNSGTKPVIVQTGQVNCQEALSVAEEYIARAGEAQGQGQRLTVQGWQCSWPYLPGRTHADSYLQCTDPSEQNTVSIGS